jgi:hypothetical protein
MKEEQSFKISLKNITPENNVASTAYKTGLDESV